MRLARRDFVGLAGAFGIGHNEYKVQEIKTFVERLVLSMI